MTRKQALHKALEALTDNGAKEKIQEILADMPLMNWSEKSIFDTIDQFILGKWTNPNCHRFQKKGSATTHCN